jgi:hypothetical protein
MALAQQPKHGNELKIVLDNVNLTKLRRLIKLRRGIKKNESPISKKS